MRRVIASCWFHPWIPGSKIICSNWELISRFRCLLASWIPRFDFFKVIWEVQYCKCFKIQVPHSLWFLKWHKNYLSGNCFSLHCKYLVKQFPACCFILKNGNSWRKEPLIGSKKSKSRPFFFVIWEFMIFRPLRPFRLRVPLFYAHKNKSTHFIGAFILARH